MATVSICRSELHFVSKRGENLRHRSWIPEEANRALVLVHGLGEHSKRYEHFATWFASRGFAVHAYDHLGQGESDGIRTHVNRFDDYLDDLEIFLTKVKEQHPELPLTLVGHSLGGLVVARFVVMRKPELASVVTSGAALAVGDNVTPLKEFLLKGMRRILPRLRISNELDVQGLSRDSSVIDRYENDPLVVQTVTLSLGFETIATIRDTVGRGGSVRIPILMLHGGADPIVSPEGTRNFFSKVKVAGSDSRIYRELRHEIFNEPEQETVFEDILNWILGAK